jgi:hypothetical protein
VIWKLEFFATQYFCILLHKKRYFNILFYAMQANIQQPFTNLQREMLSLFAKNVPETHLQEIKTMIARYLLEKAMDEADKVWVERGYSAETMSDLLHSENT